MILSLLTARAKLIGYILVLALLVVGWAYIKHVTSLNDSMSLQLTQYEQSNASLAETVARLSFEKKRSEELLSDQVERNKKLDESLSKQKANMIKLGEQHEDVKEYLDQRIPDQLFDQLRE